MMKYSCNKEKIRILRLKKTSKEDDLCNDDRELIDKGLLNNILSLAQPFHNGKNPDTTGTDNVQGDKPRKRKSSILNLQRAEDDKRQRVQELLSDSSDEQELGDI